jgi:hypothetical protein
MKRTYPIRHMMVNQLQCDEGTLEPWNDRCAMRRTMGIDAESVNHKFEQPKVNMRDEKIPPLSVWEKQCLWKTKAQQVCDWDLETINAKSDPDAEGDRDQCKVRIPWGDAESIPSLSDPKSTQEEKEREGIPTWKAKREVEPRETREFRLCPCESVFGKPKL